MRQIPDQEVLTLVELKQKRQRLEMCQFVCEASAGRSIVEVAKLLGHSPEWVRDHLRDYAIESARTGKSRIARYR